MPCEFPSKGKGITLIVIDGTKTLAELLKSITGSLPATGWKLEATLDLEDGGYSIHIHGKGGTVLGACIVLPDESVLEGTRALEHLSKIIGQAPSRGYIELLEIGEEGLEVDFEASPGAKLPKPVEYSSILETGPPRTEEPAEKVEAQPPQREATDQDARKEASPPVVPSRSATSSQDSGMIGVVRKMASSSAVSLGEIEMMLAEIIIYSKVVGSSRDFNSLFEEALQRSTSNGVAFYRLAVYLKDNSVIEIFIYAGRLCNALLLPAGGGTPEPLGTDPEKVRRVVAEKRVARALLYRVECEECTRIFLKECAGGRGVQEQEETVGKQERKRRGLLGRLFGRR